MVSAVNSWNLARGNIEPVHHLSSLKWTWPLDHYAFVNTKRARKRLKNVQYLVGMLKGLRVRLG